MINFFTVEAQLIQKHFLNLQVSIPIDVSIELQKAKGCIFNGRTRNSQLSFQIIPTIESSLKAMNEQEAFS